MDKGATNTSLIGWSPNGDLIALVLQSPKRGLHVVAPDGSGLRQLSQHSPTAAGFSKDGSAIYFARREPDGLRILSIDVASGAERVLTASPIPAEQLEDSIVEGISLHPDGKRIAIAITTEHSDVWLMEGFPTRLPLFVRKP